MEINTNSRSPLYPVYKVCFVYLHFLDSFYCYYKTLKDINSHLIFSLGNSFHIMAMVNIHKFIPFDPVYLPVSDCSLDIRAHIAIVP